MTKQDIQNPLAIQKNTVTQFQHLVQQAIIKQSKNINNKINEPIFFFLQAN